MSFMMLCLVQMQPSEPKGRKQMKASGTSVPTGLLQAIHSAPRLLMPQLTASISKKQVFRMRRRPGSVSVLETAFYILKRPAREFIPHRERLPMRIPYPLFPPHRTDCFVSAALIRAPTQLPKQRPGQATACSHRPSQSH